MREETASGRTSVAASPAAPTESTRPPSPPEPVEPAPVPPVPVTDDAIGSKSLDDINRDSPLKPLFYGLDQRKWTRPASRSCRPTPKS